MRTPAENVARAAEESAGSFPDIKPAYPNARAFRAFSADLSHGVYGKGGGFSTLVGIVFCNLLIRLASGNVGTGRRRRLAFVERLFCREACPRRPRRRASLSMKRLVHVSHSGLYLQATDEETRRDAGRMFALLFE